MRSFNPDRDDGHSDETFKLDQFGLDQARMLGIAERVPEQLRRAGWRNHYCVVVIDFSELAARHGVEKADQLVRPIEIAIVQEDWLSTREYAFPKERIVEQIVAWKPKSTPIKLT
jgi:hypothetical protein